MLELKEIILDHQREGLLQPTSLIAREGAVSTELVIEIPTERINESVDFIKKCMEEKPFEDFDVPLVAEAAAGKTFGTLKDLED